MLNKNRKRETTKNRTINDLIHEEEQERVTKTQNKEESPEFPEEQKNRTKQNPSDTRKKCNIVRIKTIKYTRNQHNTQQSR